MKTLQLVLAADSELGIGRAGTLPWRLSGDMAHFKALTSKTKSPDGLNAVVMGRKTWDSIPDRFRPLPGRLNVVLSRRAPELPEDVLGADSLDAALETLRSRDDVEQIFVIGGGEIYADAVQREDCTTVHLTRVDGSFDCDTFFAWNPEHFGRGSVSDAVTENGISYRFETYVRRADVDAGD